LPNADSKGPYFTDGTECKLDGSGGDGDGGGGDGGGDGSSGDFGKKWEAFNDSGYEHVSTTLSKLNKNLGKQLVDINGRSARMYDLLNTSTNTVLSELQESYKTNSILNEALPYIKESASNTYGTNMYLSRMEPQLELANIHLKKIADAATNGGGSGEGGGSSSEDTAAIKNMMQTAMSWWSMNPNYLQSINNQAAYISGDLGAIKGMTEGMGSAQIKLQQQMAGDLAAIKDAIKNGSGSGGEGGGGDKPCTGPLCTFSPSGTVPGSGLSDVFGEVAIAGVKQQVTEKKVEIQAQMDEIKGVFAPGKLEVSGTYENDYHNINGARVDLSGKSNIELFFSSGPAQVIWFLAVLIAFGILLGGRRDA